MDQQSLARLWPNRSHESNWLKGVLCYFGFHRWQALDVPLDESTTKYEFCRWCPKHQLPVD